MIFFKKFFLNFCTIILFSLFIFWFVEIAKAQDSSFLKPGHYNKSVCIENPEKSLLAEAFLRVGVSVYDSNKYSFCKETGFRVSGVFTFKTHEENNKFIVFIYYWGDYVGRYVYFKKNTPEDIPEFVRSFVNWMLETAWKKEF
jgi:hypothetical protein